MPSVRIGAILALAAVSSVVAQIDQLPVRYDGSSVLRVTISSFRDLQALQTIGDVWTHTPMLERPIDVLVSPEGRTAVEGLGLPFDVLIPDVQAMTEAQRAEIDRIRGERGRGWFDTYHTLDEINAYIDTIAASRPDVISAETIGTSLEGRPIRAMRISAPDSINNPRSQRTQLLFNGCQHAREWASPSTMMYFADRLTATYGIDERTTSIMDRAEFLIVPIVNPDGYLFTWTTERYWRKNRRDNGDGTRGVDLNRNWGYGWGGEGASTSPSSDTYRGTGAFSEPETRVVRDFVLANPRIRAYIDFHTYSQLILSPWGYTSDLPPDHSKFVSLNDSMTSAIQSVHGSVYVAGPTYTTIYPASGVASDWAYGAGSTPRKILGWGFELRDTGEFGFELPPDQIIPTGEENLEGVKILAERVVFPIRMALTSGAPEYVAVGGSTPVTARITSGIDDTVNAASVKLFTSIDGGAFTSTIMSSLGGDLFEGSLSAPSCDSSVQWYIEASTTDGDMASLPANAPTSSYSSVPAEEYVVYTNACETVAGWQVGAAGDNATNGIWGLSDPEATAAQPGDDHTVAGTKAWITDGRAGSSVGTYDVDGGSTTLTSAAFSATPPVDVIVQSTSIEYWRWHSNNQGGNPGEDSMPISISSNGGSTWTELEAVSDNTNAWTRRSFTIANPTEAMKLRLVARDLNGGSIVEAGIDDVRVIVWGCPRDPADFNGDGFVNGDDFDEFVAAFENGDIAADFNGDGFVTGDDFDAFVDAFEN